MSSDDKKQEAPRADTFWVENDGWTFGRKLVCLASDSERIVQKLWEENERLRERAKTAQERADDWEKAARLAKQQRNLVRVVK
jgi:hypothetical protein